MGIGPSERFKAIAAKNLGCAVIIAGSDSDRSHIEKLVGALKGYEIPVEVRVASAHRQAIFLTDLLEEYDRLEGALAYITVAGGTDALSGRVAFKSYRPTISCPPDHPNMSCLTNPTDSSNAYVGRPENVARFIAQMFSAINPGYRQRVEVRSLAKEAHLSGADGTFMKEFGEER